MDKIANPQIQELAEALAARLPTRAEIHSAMLLAYQVGKNDGALEVSNRLLQKYGEPEAPKAVA